MLMQNKTSKMSPLARGLLIFTVLAALTAVEYFLAISSLPAVFLWTVAILKAALVLWFFMHISRLFEREEEHE